MQGPLSRRPYAIAAIDAVLPEWQRTAAGDAREVLAVALDEHGMVLAGHLADEEKLVLPLVEQHLTVAEWDVVGRRGLETIPRNKVLLVLGAILEDATPQEQRYFLDRTPAVGRLMRRIAGKRQYAARMAALRGPVSR